jgi:hypothetical protein
VRPLLDFAEECSGESSDLLTLVGMQVFPRRVEVARSSRLNLNEDESGRAVHNEINLARSSSVVARN